MFNRLFDRLLWNAPTGREPASAVVHLHRESVVDAPIDETFTFFSDAANLERLTPPWLNFTIRTPTPVTMREGAEIDYEIVLHGLKIPWRSRIDVWEPGVRFVDRQVLGPYRWWHHEHRFEAIDGRTRVIDHVEFIPRVRVISGWLAGRDVERIFTFRQQVLPGLLAARRVSS